MTTPDPAPSPHPGMSFAGFVVLIALMMALGAVSIDAMLPALEAIAKDLGAAQANQRQWIVTAYLLGFGAFQIVYGPLADRYGRKPVLLVGLGLYAAFSLLAALSTSFPMLIAARVLQGVGAASTRVAPISIVRDCYAGRQMARVLSLAFLVFMIVPVLAPSLGAAITAFASWRWLFGGLALLSAAAGVWAWRALPETLRPEDRIPIQLGPMLHAFGLALRDRAGTGYTIASVFVFGALFGYINSAQQIFAQAFHAPTLFPIIFAVCAGFIAVSSLLNAKLVERVGTRRLSHGALIGFIVTSALHAAVAISGRESLLWFTVFQSAAFFFFGLLSGNFGAMALETLGHVAGSASAIQGFISMVGASLIGVAIGQAFDGTLAPLAVGYTIFGLAGLVAVLWAEKGRLFQAHHGGAPAEPGFHQ